MELAEYTIQEIGNGWLLTGPFDHELPAAGERQLFLPTISAVADVLITWQTSGFIPATERAKDRYRGK